MQKKEKSPYLYILAGPTGVGKTNLSLCLASLWNTEIISADSMQVYRQLSIGTAKPESGELHGIPYHLINCVNIDENYDLSRFIHDADEIIDRLTKEEKRPFVVGGTGLYIKGLLEGIFQMDSRSPEIRRELYSRIEAGDLPQLFSELRRIDPKAAARIKSGDRQRIVRALEVYRITGRPISFHQEMSRKTGFRYPHKLIVVTRDRREIYQRIENRIDRMFARGFLHEVEQILKSGFSRTLHPLKALGYREVISYLEGRLSLDEARQEMKKSTRRYAKRQLTWFKAMPQAIWMNISGLSEEEALRQITDIFEVKTGE